jgi:DNA repair protein endonuclease SAE2/CtIP C-terminus
LPALPKAPLWASPSKTPTHSRKGCRKSHHHGTVSSSHSDPEETPSKKQREQRELEIQAHKKNISRHRQTWDRAKTPPDYWNIGFPNTQEVGEINERAEQMHLKKMKDVERQVQSGNSRYKRRT